jgi:hypothetical protein
MKPGYIDPTGERGRGTVALKPPFVFREVTARVFPLKANMGRLTDFCDQYLNMDIPDTIVHYTPALPYVYFTVLNYGGMSPTSRAAQHAGWIAQHEVTFTIPLQRWRRDPATGKLKFLDWASVSPFIYVDDAMSQTTGREVYGWPKVLAHIDADTPLWTAHPRAGSRLFTLSTPMFADLYAGEAETPRVLLQVDREPAASYAEFPPNLKCPWSITSVVPNLISSSFSLMGDAIDILGGLRLRGYPPGRSLDSVVSMAGKAGSMAIDTLAGLFGPMLGKPPTPGANDDLDPYHIKVPGALPRLFNNTVNLKQYRDAESPNLACYTALVNSRMGVDRVNQFGLLGDWDLLRGDPSGGYNVRIHRYDSQPVIDALGLEVSALSQQSDGRTIATLKPSFPFWVDVDMYYGTGQVICSRTPSLHDPEDQTSTWWRDETGAEPAPWRGKTAGPAPRVALEFKSPGSFNIALGPASQPVAGPFEFPDVTVQVYPLLADQEKLQDYVNTCWNEPLAAPDGETPSLRFETMGSYVYMLVSVNGDKRGTMWSGSNNLGWWADREVSFCIPLACYRNGELITVALIEPFVYANSGRLAITDHEVNGRNAVVAQIDSPVDVWSTEAGPAGDRRLLLVSTEIIPAAAVGSRAGQQMLIEIDERDVLSDSDEIAWQGIADTWGQDIVDDLKRKSQLAETRKDEVGTVKALALEILAHQAPVNRLTMKQYRDAADIDRACYQAVVLTERSLTQVYDAREIEQRLHIRINRLPGHPIVKALGLKVKCVQSGGGSVWDTLQPIRPFWMRVAVREQLGQTIATVMGTEQTGKTDGRAKPVEAEQRNWHFHRWLPAAPAQQRRRSARPSATESPADVPFFAASGRTRVGASLLDELADGNGQELRDVAASWLRRSLTNQLALLRVSIDALPPENTNAAAKFSKIADAALMRRAEPLCRVTDPEKFRLFCDALSEADATSLAQEIEAALNSATARLKTIVAPRTRQHRPMSDPMTFAFEPWWYSPEWAAYALQQQMKGTGWEAYKDLNEPPGITADDKPLLKDIQTIVKWIMEPTGGDPARWADMISTQAKFAVWNLQVALRWMKDFNADQFQMLAMTLPTNVDRARRHLLLHQPDSQFYALQNQQDEQQAIATMVDTPFDADPTFLLQELANGLLRGVYDWKEPDRWVRKTHQQAGDAVAALGEIQLVLESILSDEWASRSKFLRSNQPYRLGPDDQLVSGKKPAHCVPVRSVGPLGLPTHSWAENAGLGRWPENAADDRETWEFVTLGYKSE